ncbi:PKD domain-containing protein [Flavobacterium sp. DGU38]|uniref:PKD domain-containing protein n=1 Tax=Flavobacterium calami TaxID=3139144 RepID=A0ABU9IT55_9FLAO
MRKKITVLFVVVLSVFSFSCGDDLEKALDCTGENLLVQLESTADASNVKKIDYEIDYSGSYTVKSVKWTFGDGSVQTVNGTTVSHTYTAAGTFLVKADVTLKSGGSSCTSTHSKSVTVN